jgi:hypothetical protein
MRCWFTDCEGKDMELPNTKTFNVFVAYQTFRNEQRAKVLLERIAGALPTEDSDRLPCAMWNFSVPATALNLKMAAESAYAADVIVIAAHEKGCVPATIENWVDHWLPKKAGTPCALVALLELGEQSTETPPVFESYLRKLAIQGNFAFFAETTNYPRQDGGHTTSLIDGVLERVFPSLPQNLNFV